MLIAGGAVGVVVGVRRSRAEMPDRHRDLGIGYPGQALARGPAGGYCGQALLDVALMAVHMQVSQRLDGGAAGGIDMPQRDQVVGQGPGLVAGPGVERGDQLPPGRSSRSAKPATRRGDGGRRPWESSDGSRSRERARQHRASAGFTIGYAY